MDIQVYATETIVVSEPYTSNVLLRGVDLGDLLAQINTTDVLEALKANDQYDSIVEFVQKEEDDE